MSKVRIAVELPEGRLLAIQEEARRRGVTVESLVEETVTRLLKEEQERLVDDVPIIPC